MVATLQSAKPLGTFTSFADMVNSHDSFTDLKTKGFTLTEKQKNACKKICGEELPNLDGGRVIGNSFGGIIQYVGYTLVTCVQNLCSGNFSAIGDIISNFGSALSTTSDQSKLWALQQDAAHIYLRLVDAGIPAGAAEYLTGVKPSDDNSAPKLIDSSILNQVHDKSGIKLPVDTDTSLDDRRAALAMARQPAAKSLHRH